MEPIARDDTAQRRGATAKTGGKGREDERVDKRGGSQPRHAVRTHGMGAPDSADTRTERRGTGEAEDTDMSISQMQPWLEEHASLNLEFLPWTNHASKETGRKPAILAAQPVSVDPDETGLQRRQRMTEMWKLGPPGRIDSDRSPRAPQGRDDVRSSKLQRQQRTAEMSQEPLPYRGREMQPKPSPYNEHREFDVVVDADRSREGEYVRHDSFRTPPPGDSTFDGVSGIFGSASSNGDHGKQSPDWTHEQQRRFAQPTQQARESALTPVPAQQVEGYPRRIRNQPVRLEMSSTGMTRDSASADSMERALGGDSSDFDPW